LCPTQLPGASDALAANGLIVTNSIASLSLGEERIFILKHKTRKDLKPVRLKLASGSLLLMKGETQRYWKHGIEKETRPCGPRVNLTFRHIHL
jgi:alkylated DNA repair dioxygenase AlkB